MERISMGTGEGKPDTLILMHFMNIHWECICSWVYDKSNVEKKLKRLKYINAACPAANWHRQLGMEIERRRMAANGRRR